MKKYILIIVILTGININYSQEVMTDWNDLCYKTSLIEYIENHANYYLSEKPSKKNTVKNNGQKKTHCSSHSGFVQNDINFDNLPVIIINRNQIEDEPILNSLRLFHFEKITLQKPTEQTVKTYGESGKKGVIFVEIDKKKWRKLKRKHGR